MLLELINVATKCFVKCYELCIEFSIGINYETINEFLIFGRYISHSKSDKNSQFKIIEIQTANKMRTINVLSSVLCLV